MDHPLQEFAFETISLDRRGELREQRLGSAFEYLEDLGGGVALAMVSVPGGTFQMGSQRGAGYPDEMPQHLVALAPFLIGKYPVTQAQYQAVMGRLPDCRGRGPQRPVENLSWKDAQEFCKRLSKKTGRAYELPSEAQWEYACRGGTATPFSTGESITTDAANYVGMHTFLDEPAGIYRHGTTPVGGFLPNAYGLYDMHGNVWEMCADLWHADYTGAPFDGKAWVHGGEAGYRVARGGSWHEPPANCRSAVRLRLRQEDKDDFYGFRVAAAGVQPPDS